MHESQYTYRELLTKLDGCKDGRLEPIIQRWLADNLEEIKWVHSLKCLHESGVPEMTMEDSWRFYALSRVSDALIKAIGNDGSRVCDFSIFMEGLGLNHINAESFHPFYHEVVAVTASADVDAQITTTSILWPGFMCGPLMIARAGVCVAGGIRHIRKEIAETSTLYWSYRRAQRPTEDLSIGWGGNSQWRTRFRRDYLIAGQFHYNVDGSNDIREMTLNECERLELLRNRCFIQSTRPHTDLYPYDLRHAEGVA